MFAGGFWKKEQLILNTMNYTAKVGWQFQHAYVLIPEFFPTLALTVIYLQGFWKALLRKPNSQD